jgi:chitinase
MIGYQAYDYAGSWLTFTDNQANVYHGVRTGINTDSALTWYLQNGASASKINLGERTLICCRIWEEFSD